MTDAHQAVEQAKTRGRQALDPDLLAGLRARYDKAVESGRIHNRCRDWPDGNHPGYTRVTAQITASTRRGCSASSNGHSRAVRSNRS